MSSSGGLGLPVVLPLPLRFSSRGFKEEKEEDEEAEEEDKIEPARPCFALLLITLPFLANRTASEWSTRFIKRQ